MEHWHWIAIGVVFLVSEMFVPGVILVWLGLAGLILGFALLVGAPLGIGMQLLVFAVLSLLGVLVGRRYFHWNRGQDKASHLSKRDTHLVGREIVLLTAMAQGRGKARVGDTDWLVRDANGSCEGMQADQVVRVHSVDRTTLLVTKA